MKHLWFEKGAYASKKARLYQANEFDPSKVKNIAVIRHAALGDQVITRAFLIEARKFFPNAKITLCAVSNYQYAMPSDLVDSVHIMPGRQKGRKVTLSEKLRKANELEDQDIIFDLAATNRSYWLLTFTKAKLKIGFPYRPALAKLFYDIAIFRSDLTPEVESMLHMLKLLGHNPSYPLDFGYPDNRSQRDTEKPYIVYFGGASQERKMYPFDKLTNLMNLAAAELPDYQHIYLEGISDTEKGDKLGKLTSDNINIQPSMDLDEVITFIAKASVVVSTDTGIRNVAISTHTPTVGIFYATVPFRYTPVYENHYITMNSNADIPTPEAILNTICKATNDINK